MVWMGKWVGGWIVSPNSCLQVIDLSNSGTYPPAESVEIK